MAAKRTFRIEIPKPCQENWQKMDPREQGRYCESCEKTVIDFTGLSDRAVLDIFLREKNLCGRFDNSQLNRDMFVYHRRPLWKQWLGHAGMAGLLLSQLFPKKASAQQDSTSDSVKIIPEEAPVFVNVYRNDYMRGHVVQPDSVHRALSLDFVFDTFSMHVDLAQANDFSFQLPQLANIDSFNITVNSSDSSWTITSSFHDYFRPIALESPRMKLYYEDQWKLFTWNEHTHIRTIGVVPLQFEMGNIIEWEPQKYSVYPFTINLIADTTGKDSAAVETSVREIPAEQKKTAQAETHTANHRWFYLVLLLPVFWVLNAFVKRKKRKETGPDDLTDT